MGLDGIVMPGLVPGIHVFKASRSKDMDGRDRRAYATPSFGRYGAAITEVVST